MLKHLSMLPLIVGLVLCEESGAEPRRFDKAKSKAPASSPAPAPALHPIACFVRDMCAAGIDTVFIAEAHGELHNFPIVTQTLCGVCAAGPFVFWRELNDDPGTEAANDALLLDRQSAVAFFSWSIQLTANQQMALQHPDWPLFRRTLMHKNATAIGWFHFYSPSERSMTKFLRQPRTQVASVGAAHAEFQYESPTSFRTPGGDVWTSREYAEPYGGLPDDAQRDIFGGFSRFNDAANGMLIRPGSVWDLPGMKDSRLPFAAGYAAKGFATLDWVMDSTFNMSFVVGSSFLPAMVKALAARPRHELAWHCSGMSGCPAAVEDRDEL